MVITKVVSGLGNQFFQYAIGRQHAIKHHIPLKLDISFFNPTVDNYVFDQLTRTFKLNKYNIKAELATEDEIRKLTDLFREKTFYARIYRRIIKFIPNYKRQYFKEIEPWMYNSDIYKLNSNVYLDGYWQNYKYAENFPTQILEELTLKEDYQNIYKQEIENDDNSVSVHVRRGDYVNDGLFATQPVNYYATAINIINKKVKNAKYYVFSDDSNWAKQNIAFDLPVVFVENQPDYIDLDLMSKCRHNIIANSSFSWWAAMLNKNETKIVIAPSRWVLKDELNDKIELAFPTWIKI